MKLRAGTGIFVDKPSINGIVYTRAAVEAAIRDGTLRGRIAEGMLGGLLNRDLDRIAEVSKPTHRVLDILLEDDQVVVDLELLDTPEGQLIRDAIKFGHKIVARPILAVEDVVGISRPVKVEDFSFHRVQLEMEPNNGDGHPV